MKAIRYPLLTEEPEVFALTPSGTPVFFKIELFSSQNTSVAGLKTIELCWSFCYEFLLDAPSTFSGELSFYLINNLANGPETIQQEPFISYKIENGVFPDKNTVPPAYLNGNQLLLLDAAYSTTAKNMIIKWVGGESSTGDATLSAYGQNVYGF